MKLFQRKSGMIVTDLLLLIGLLLCIVLTAVCCQPRKTIYSYDDEMTDLTDGWIGEDGDTYSLTALPTGDVVLTHDLQGIDLRRKRLCFKCVDTHISAAFDGETTYRFAPEQPAILGKSYGMYVQMVPIPADADTVTLTLHPIYPDAPAVIREVTVGDAGLYMGDIYHQGLPSFALCVLIALFGVLMLIIGFTTRNTSESDTVNFFSLGVFAILVGIWSANDTYILQVFTQQPAMVRLSNYGSLMFIAYLPVSFMASATNHRRTPLLPVLWCLTVVNFFLTMTLSLLGIRDVRQMLVFSHINIAAALGMTIYLMVRAVRKKTVATKFLHTVTVGMTAAVLGTVGDLIRFQVFPDSTFGASFFTRIGVLTFVILMGLHLMGERTRLAVERGRAELMEKMAYSDGLTGLSNRAAFHEKEDEIRRGKTACVIVQLDINFLKRVNDVYGHAEGDRHIIGAAHLIRDCFAPIGTCYRTGGDEFIVVVQNGDTPDVDAALARLDEGAAAYNAKETPPVPLQIAYGYAHYAKHADLLEEAEKLADERMYEKKRAMKEQAV